MTHKTLVIALLGASLAAPATLNAEHRYQRAVLLPAAVQLHQSTIAFEQIAASRPLAVYQQNQIRLLTKHACRLVEGLECSAPWGRVKADQAVLQGFIPIIDRQIVSHCRTRYDRQLQRAWQCVLNDFEAFSCRFASAGQPAPLVRSGYRQHVEIRLGPQGHFGWGSPVDRGAFAPEYAASRAPYHAAARGSHLSHGRSQHPAAVHGAHDRDFGGFRGEPHRGAHAAGRSAVPRDSSQLVRLLIAALSD